MRGGDSGERDLGPGGRADQIALDIGDGVPLVRRQADVYADVLAAALHPQGLVAEEGGSHLASQLVDGEAQSVRFRLEL